MYRSPPLLQHYSELGAEIGEFAGWRTPLWFTSNREEHVAVRSSTGIFDVTHMTRILVEGRDAEKLLQEKLTIDVQRIKPGKMKYSLMCNEAGGIIDDLTVLKHPSIPERYIITSNAITRDKVLRILKSSSENLDVEIEDITFRTCLFAVQGPRSLETMSKFTNLDLKNLKWFTSIELTLEGVETLLTRSGYTGENGYELLLWSWDTEKLKKIWNGIVRLGVTPCGLAARDSLRIESGYPLYGQDIDEETNPVEARLMFAVDMSKQKFTGKEAIEKILREGNPKKILVYFKCIERAIPRKGYQIIDMDGRLVGEVTSGGFSFTLGIGIGLCYVKPDYAKEGERLKLRIKDKQREIEITLNPAVPHRMKET